jgi:DNA-binding response OmpR family regulator
MGGTWNTGRRFDVDTKEVLTSLQEAVATCPRVLVVEDDAGIAEAVAYALERDGLSTRTAGTVENARAAGTGFDLAILDLGLPDGSGYTLLAEWRGGRDDRAVIVLTSRDGEVDCVASLEAGADDFVCKPFSPRALVARARAVLRRRERSVLPARLAGPLALDPAGRTATFEGCPVELTRIEFDLLSTLAAAPGRVHTREQLVQRVWGDRFALTERTVDSHVKALRRKLGEAGAAASFIVAVRGIGFKLSEPS